MNLVIMILCLMTSTFAAADDFGTPNHLRLIDARVHEIAASDEMQTYKNKTFTNLEDLQEVVERFQKHMRLAKTSLDSITNENTKVIHGRILSSFWLGAVFAPKKHSIFIDIPLVEREMAFQRIHDLFSYDTTHQELVDALVKSLVELRDSFELSKNGVNDTLAVFGKAFSSSPTTIENQQLVSNQMETYLENFRKHYEVARKTRFLLWKTERIQELRVIYADANVYYQDFTKSNGIPDLVEDDLKQRLKPYDQWKAISANTVTNFIDYQDSEKDSDFIKLRAAAHAGDEIAREFFDKSRFQMYLVDFRRTSSWKILQARAQEGDLMATKTIVYLLEERIYHKKHTENDKETLESWRKYYEQQKSKRK